MSKNGIKEAKRIAKEIGGHIPERVVDEHIPNDEKLLLIPKDTITITKEKYEELIRDAGYYQGRADELEKQLEELKRPEEVIALDQTKTVKKSIISRLENEINRLNHMKLKDEEYGVFSATNEKEYIRINGNIEGLEKAIKKIREDQCEK